MQTERKYVFWQKLSIIVLVGLYLSFPLASASDESRCIKIRVGYTSCFSSGFTEGIFRLRKGSFKSEHVSSYSAKSVCSSSFSKVRTEQRTNNLDASLVLALKNAIVNSVSQQTLNPEQFGFTSDRVNSQFSPSSPSQNAMQLIVAKHRLSIHKDDINSALHELLDPRPLCGGGGNWTVEIAGSPRCSATIENHFARTFVKIGDKEYKVYSPEVYDALQHIMMNVDIEDEPPPPLPSGRPESTKTEDALTLAAVRADGNLPNKYDNEKQICFEPTALIVHKTPSIKASLLHPNSGAWEKIAWLTIKRNLNTIIAANQPPDSLRLTLIDCKPEEYPNRINLFYKTDSKIIDRTTIATDFEGGKFIDWSVIGSNFNRMTLCTKKLPWLERWKARVPGREVHADLSSNCEDDIIWKKNGLPGKQDVVFSLRSKQAQVATVVASVDTDNILYQVTNGSAPKPLGSNFSVRNKLMSANCNTFPPEFDLETSH